LRGGEHAGAGVRWLAILAGLTVAAALAAVAWLFLARGGALVLGDEAPSFRFDLRRVSSVATDGKASKAELRQAAKEIRATLDAMYLAGFVDPDRWDGGAFPEVLEAFSSQTAAGAEEDLAELTLGSAHGRLDAVTPGRSQLDVEFLLDGDRLPFAAIATTVFRAEGQLAGGGSLSVTHEGRYVMRPVDGRWVIVGYQVDGKLRPAPAQPSPGSSP
jgi:hypothetical protein